ncbi:MAG: hypothetical protein ACOY45_15660 [Pseudomonadota bacterium]
MSDVLQWTIVCFIVLFIVWHVFRSGARNPETTGDLGVKVSGLSNQMTTLTGRLRHVEVKVDELEREAATVKDIQRLEERIEGHHQLSQRTNHSVERIERFLIEKGLSGK